MEEPGEVWPLAGGAKAESEFLPIAGLFRCSLGLPPEVAELMEAAAAAAAAAWPKKGRNAPENGNRGSIKW